MNSLLRRAGIWCRVESENIISRFNNAGYHRLRNDFNFTADERVGVGVYLRTAQLMRAGKWERSCAVRGGGGWPGKRGL